MTAITTAAVPSQAQNIASGELGSPSQTAAASTRAASNSAYRKARRILKRQVIQPENLAPGDELIAFRMARPLPPGTKIQVYRNRGRALNVRQSSWFFWIDDNPKAQFEHQTRFVLINAATGKVQVAKRNWWPVVNGKSLWYTYRQYWNSANWAFSTLTPPGPRSNSSSFPAALTSRMDLRAGSTSECAVLVDGSGDAKAGFPDDVKGMERAINGFGYTVKKLTPPNNNQADLEKAVADLIENGCTDVLIYIASHGGKKSMDLGKGTYTPAKLKKLMEKYPAVGFKVVLQGCKTGSWITPLGETPLITITSTDSEKDSYSADPDGKDDPNPGDTGSEFTSGLIEDLEAITKDPTLRQWVRLCVASGQSPLVCKLYLAFNSALAKDEDAKAGKEDPQRRQRQVEIIHNG